MISSFFSFLFSHEFFKYFSISPIGSMLFRSNITLFDKVLVSNSPFFFRDIIKYPQVIFQHINSPSKFSNNYIFSLNVSIVIILPPKPFHCLKITEVTTVFEEFQTKVIFLFFYLFNKFLSFFPYI